ncbi:hypothetical protein ANCCAN_22451 [Ancylostoma caninum]|uniref:Kelch repeat protein n=1 Tax=Ancylostoma caninum TaxID=29170 RepID=A0A368FL75_ANCCA|nr:hypothetical protein ANCCAN_22451 [Ancylostoma caninum]
MLSLLKIVLQPCPAQWVVSYLNLQLLLEDDSGCEGQNEYSSEFDEYDPLVKRWTTMQPMNAARAFHAITENDGKVYVIGGKNEKGYLNSVEF